MVYDVTMMMTEIINCRSLLFFFLFVGSGLLMPPTFRLLLHEVSFIPVKRIEFTTATTIPRVQATRLTVIR